MLSPSIYQIRWHLTTSDCDTVIPINQLPSNQKFSITHPHSFYHEKHILTI